MGFSKGVLMSHPHGGQGPGRGWRLSQQLTPHFNLRICSTAWYGNSHNPAPESYPPVYNQTTSSHTPNVNNEVKQKLQYWGCSSDMHPTRWICSYARITLWRSAPAQEERIGHSMWGITTEYTQVGTEVHVSYTKTTAFIVFSQWWQPCPRSAAWRVPAPAYCPTMNPMICQAYNATCIRRMAADLSSCRSHDLAILHRLQENFLDWNPILIFARLNAFLTRQLGEYPREEWCYGPCISHYSTSSGLYVLSASSQLAPHSNPKAKCSIWLHDISPGVSIPASARIICWE